MQKLQPSSRLLRAFRIPRVLWLLCMLTPSLLLFMGETACETMNFDNNSGGSSYDRRDDNHDYDRHDDYDDHSSAPVRTYDYYPDRQVFYNHTTGDYTYWNNDQLERRHELPGYIREQLGRSRTVHLRGDEPERYFDRVKRDYPGGGIDNQERNREEDHRSHRNDRIPPGARVYGNHDDAQAYDYYPARDVFFNLDTHSYTWRNNGRWDSGAEVPDSIRRQMDRHERIYIAGSPQRYYDEIRRDFH